MLCEHCLIAWKIHPTWSYQFWSLSADWRDCRNQCLQVSRAMAKHQRETCCVFNQKCNVLKMPYCPTANIELWCFLLSKKLYLSCVQPPLGKQCCGRPLQDVWQLSVNLCPIKTLRLHCAVGLLKSEQHTCNDLLGRIYYRKCVPVPTSFTIAKLYTSCVIGGSWLWN